MSPHRRRWVRVLGWFLGGLLGLVGLFVFVIAPYLMASLVTRAGTRPPDRRLKTSPADYGLTFEEVSFEARDGTRIAGWYLGGGEGGISIACGHGLFRSRREVLDRAAFLRQSGYNVLAFDFRRHGASAGELITLGHHETWDVEAAVRFLSEREPSDSLVVLGVSMGAAAGLLAAAETEAVVAVIAEASFVSLSDAVARDLRLIFRLPRFPIGSTILFFIGRRGGFDPGAVDVEEAVRRMGERPVLFIAGTQDRRMPLETQQVLYRASKSEGSRLLVIEGAGHGDAFKIAPDRYRQAASKFLEPFAAAR
jgi:pimeloyl-ACP methyl ester carboxylesterase